MDGRLLQSDYRDLAKTLNKMSHSQESTRKRKSDLPDKLRGDADREVTVLRDKQRVDVLNSVSVQISPQGVRPLGQSGSSRGGGGGVSWMAAWK